MGRALLTGLAVGALAVAGVLVATRGGDDGVADEAIVVTRPSSSITTVASGTPTTASPTTRLPGITVVGYAEVEVKPDLAMVRLQVGSGDRFGNEEVTLIDESKLDPVVDALVDEGADRDEIYVDPYSGSSYGFDGGQAVIAFEWPRPKDVKSAIVAAQRALRRTDFGLQGVSVSFVRDDCGVEQRAIAAALDDARRRAERIAALSHAELGGLVAVSEASSTAYLTGSVPLRCGVSSVAPELLSYFSSAPETSEEVRLVAALEVTFALDE